MSLSSVWDQLKRNLLTFGYVRSTFKQTPKDIITTILSFYDDMKYWRITKGKQMDKFLNCKCTEIMYGPTFIMKNIEFQCIVAPNGYQDDHNGKVALILSVSKLPENVKYVYVYFILFCNETKYEHKVTRILCEDITNDEKYKWRSRFPWATNAINLKDLHHFKSLTFGYYVDILHIAYDIKHGSVDSLDDKQRELVTVGFVPRITHKLQIGSKIMDLIIKYQGISYWTKGVEISSQYKYEWIVCGDRLKQLQNCNFGQHFYSSNFDSNNWCLYISPAGWTKTNENMFSFQLKLLQKPYKLAAVYVVYKLETEFHNVLIEKGQIFHYKNCRSGWSFDEYKIPFDEFKKLNTMKIKLDMKIVAGYDIKTRERIQKTDWRKYGII